MFKLMDKKIFTILLRKILKLTFKYFSGCDRHLFGMQVIAMESGMPMPEIYKDPAYQKRWGW